MSYLHAQRDRPSEARLPPLLAWPPRQPDRRTRRPVTTHVVRTWGSLAQSLSSGHVKRACAGDDCGCGTGRRARMHARCSGRFLGHWSWTRPVPSLCLVASRCPSSGLDGRICMGPAVCRPPSRQGRWAAAGPGAVHGWTGGRTLLQCGEKTQPSRARGSSNTASTLYAYGARR